MIKRVNRNKAPFSPQDLRILSYGVSPGITQSVLEHILRQPYHASIYHASRHVCSGALISKLSVLTSARCVDYLKFQVKERNGWPKIRLGENDNAANEAEQM